MINFGGGDDTQLTILKDMINNSKKNISYDSRYCYIELLF